MSLTKISYVVLASLTLVACSGPSIIRPEESGWTAASDRPPSQPVAAIETTSLYWRCGKSDQQWLCREPISAPKNQQQSPPSADTLTTAAAQAGAKTTIESNIVTTVQTTGETTIVATPKTIRKSLDDSTAEEPITLAETSPKLAAIAGQRAEKALLSEYPDHFFAIQLTAAKHRENIANYRHQNPQLTATVYRARLNDKSFNLLIMGVYSNYQEAQQRLAALSPAPTETPWIRPLGPLKALLVEPLPE